MLAKVIPNKRKTSSFKQLIKYISTREVDKSTQDYELPNFSNQQVKFNQVATTEKDDLLFLEQKIVSDTGVSCLHNCISLDTAALEMKAVAVNSRAKEPVYHYILSWQLNENPTDEQVFDCVLYTLEKLGMKEHQFVSAIHRDTDNVHVHIAVNRVNPETFKCQSISHDYYKLDKAMRELELKHNWNKTNGPFDVFEQQGIKKIDWRKDTSKKIHKPDKTFMLEAHTNEVSLYQFIQDEVKEHLLTLLKQRNLSWQKIHEKLDEFNLKISPKGQGLAIFNKEMNISVKASAIHSKLSKSQLLKRIGDYKPFLPVENIKKRSLKRDPLLREQRKQARLEIRNSLKTEYKLYCQSFDRKYITKDYVVNLLKDVSSQSKNAKQHLRTTVKDPTLRKALYSVIAFEAAKEKEKILHKIAEERLKLRMDPNNRPFTYQNWCILKAQTGDQAAISQLKGWHYAELKKDNRSNGFKNTNFEDTGQIFSELNYKVNDNGSIEYSFLNKRSKILDKNAHILLNKFASNNDEVIAVALNMAKQKFNSFEITGTDEFKNKVINIINKNNLNIQLTNQEQEELLKNLKNNNKKHKVNIK